MWRLLEIEQRPKMISEGEVSLGQVGSELDGAPGVGFRQSRTQSAPCPSQKMRP